MVNLTKLPLSEFMFQQTAFRRNIHSVNDHSVKIIGEGGVTGFQINALLLKSQHLKLKKYPGDLVQVPISQRI